MDFLFVGVIGLVIGSFLNVCIYRIPREESISYPPSHCASCNHKLRPLDLIPLISFLCLKGRCRYCGEKISIRYPLIEALNCVLYLVVYMRYGFTIFTIKLCILTSLLIVIGLIDYNTQDVYTSTTLFGVIVGVIFIAVQYFIYKEGAADLILGGVAGALIIGAIVVLTGGMGEGDIEIAGMCGLFLGVKLMLLALFISVVIGGITGIIILALKLKDKKDAMAFGPCIAIGALISILLGNVLINMYFSLFMYQFN
ncbi:A24 family peptidase [uncultured Clostridium sp.]|uniref:prepilin peptidase n=1 Tax=uncultured Clostridium sp. TaxID=59620 RepID=UPI0025FB4F51|nr:A24 family peptidase [uncultured Clostridium sp.]